MLWKKRIPSSSHGKTHLVARGDGRIGGQIVTRGWPWSLKQWWIFRKKATHLTSSENSGKVSRIRIKELIIFGSCSKHAWNMNTAWGWFLLDFFLVCVGLLALVIIPALEREGQDLIDSVLIVPWPQYFQDFVVLMLANGKWVFKIGSLLA